MWEQRKLLFSYFLLIVARSEECVHWGVVLSRDMQDFEIVILQLLMHLAVLPVSFLGDFQYVRFL